MISEISIIDKFKAHFPHYIGDDAALLPMSESESYVMSKDLLAEDIHFNTSYYDSDSLAHKAVHSNISDIAAMGGKPHYLLLGLSIPHEMPEDYIDGFINGINRTCSNLGLQLVGGDTIASSKKFCISVTVIGTVPKSQIKLRSTAKAGDLLYVATHGLGYAHVGLQLLEKGLGPIHSFQEHFLRPNALLQEGLWLSQMYCITSMMDISDGLLADLRKLCSSSEVEGRIYIDNLQPDSAFIEACNALKLDPIATQLVGGEDYGLLITISPEFASNICKEFTKEFGYQLKLVGKVKDGASGYVKLKGEAVLPLLKTFSHFDDQ